MDYQEYYRITQEVSNRVDAKEYEAALKLLAKLIQGELPDIDKSMMCINCAVVWDKRDNPIEALRWYDRAIQYERPHHRYFARTEKAAYLYRIGRQEESQAIYRDLLAKPYLSFSELEKIRAFLAQTQGRG